MTPIRFDQDICGNLEAILEREWLETNGLGGFAGSTIAGLNTRRYHGLLVAATKPPVGRVVLLSKVEETLIVDGRRIELSANRYPGVIHPRGFDFLKEFRLDPFPVFLYQVEGIELEKRVFMKHGENTTVIEYELRAIDRDPLPDVRLELRPLIAYRDYHSTTHQNGAIDGRIQERPGLAAVTPYDGMPTLYLAHDAASIEASGAWYNNFEYGEEESRGLDYREDLFNPLAINYALSRRTTATLIASTELRAASQAPQMRRAEIERRAEIVASAPSAEPLVRSLVAAADQFVVKRGDQKTVIAGYHWFSDWGRDTMIALPGLTLATGRPDLAKSILLSFAESVDQGMLPNRFPDAGETPEYNTVDATLWFFEAVRGLIQYTGDVSFVRECLYDILKDIVGWHLRGTRYGIRVDDDGLLNAGVDGVQLTWMDSKIGDWVVTPRRGKPVEIQALWYNALRVMEDLARRFGDTRPCSLYRDLAIRARESFDRQFWNDTEGCLLDCVNGSARDGAVRPNQIFAVSLKHSMLADDRARRVVGVVERELLTPLGLRSLSPRDSRYRDRYAGGVWERDSSYHQGTVWPWLMGPFVTAYVRVHGGSNAARSQAARWLQIFEDHIRVAGLGHVSEIADAEAPHRPRGCVAQAWSVAELLRACVEDVFVSSAHRAVA